MLSRVADAIYWMSRYVERAENVARFLDVSLQVTLDLADPQSDPWAGIVTATGDQLAELDTVLRGPGEGKRAVGS
jgi:uncharacterized alpha-E superfamily protein